MNLYADQILDHSRHPRQKTSLPSPTVTHEEKNLSCGDRLKVDLLIEDDIVKNIGWDGDGCAISQAAMSMLGEELVGKSLTEIDALNAQDVIKLLGVPIGSRRLKCALLSLHALKNALHTHRGEAVQSWTETVAEKDGAADRD